MNDKLRNYSDQEILIQNLKDDLSSIQKMIVEKADSKGLSLEDCIEMVEFINLAIKRK